jgi:hypothetical protein
MTLSTQAQIVLNAMQMVSPESEARFALLEKDLQEWWAVHGKPIRKSITLEDAGRGGEDKLCEFFTLSLDDGGVGQSDQRVFVDLQGRPQKIGHLQLARLELLGHSATVQLYNPKFVYWLCLAFVWLMKGGVEADEEEENVPNYQIGRPRSPSSSSGDIVQQESDSPSANSTTSSKDTSSTCSDQSTGLINLPGAADIRKKAATQFATPTIMQQHMKTSLLSALKECNDASAKILKLIFTEITVVSPSPYAANHTKRPLYVFLELSEARILFQIGLHYYSLANSIGAGTKWKFQDSERERAEQFFGVTLNEILGHLELALKAIKAIAENGGSELVEMMCLIWDKLLAEAGIPWPPNIDRGAIKL